MKTLRQKYEEVEQFIEDNRSLIDKYNFIHYYRVTVEKKGVVVCLWYYDELDDVTDAQYEEIFIPQLKTMFDSFNLNNEIFAFELFQDIQDASY